MHILISNDDGYFAPGIILLAEMLAPLGFASLDSLTDAVVPESIRMRKPLDLPAARSEVETLAALRAMAAKNQEFRSWIGMGLRVGIR